MSKYYCEKHEYQPPPGMHVCPECEIDPNTGDGVERGLNTIRDIGYAVDNGLFIEALDRENERLREAIDRNINNAIAICNFVGDGLDYGDAQSVTQMAENIVNDLGNAYGIGE